MDHPMKDPEDVIEEFAIKMVLFSSIADGTDEGLITLHLVVGVPHPFYIARLTAQHLLKKSRQDTA